MPPKHLEKATLEQELVGSKSTKIATHEMQMQLKLVPELKAVWIALVIQEVLLTRLQEVKLH